MFEDLMKKLKSSVEELRKKLPGGSDDDDDEEYEDDDYEDKYHQDGDDEAEDDDGKTVKVQITDLMQKSDSDEDDDDEEASPKEKTKKIYTNDDDDDDDEDDDDYDEDEDDDVDAAAQKRKKIIMYGGVILLIGVLFMDEFLPSDPEPVPVVQVKKKRKKRKKRKKPKKVVPAEPTKPTAENKPAVVDVPPETATGLPTETKAPEPKPVEPAPVVAEPPAVEPAPVVAEPPPVEPAPVIEPPPVEAPPVIADVPAADSGLDINLGEETEKKPVANMASGDMASKIEKKLEYIAPPNYERSGRGLVYNCVGKHWACVDKFSYLTCRENSKWSTENSKKSECMIRNVYASVEDCSIIQKHYIESSEPTGFCDGEAAASAGESESAEAVDDSLDMGEAGDDLDLLE